MSILKGSAFSTRLFHRMMQVAFRHTSKISTFNQPNYEQGIGELVNASVLSRIIDSFGSPTFMNKSPLRVLLADDDEDDRNFFQEALNELPVSIQLTTVKDGVELMQWLTGQKPSLPDLLFLDLNMPRKNGYQCLAEIKQDTDLQSLPVIILSTAVNHEHTDTLYATGAWYYIQKPHTYGQLSKIVEQVLQLSGQIPLKQSAKEDFVLFPKSFFNYNR